MRISIFILLLFSLLMSCGTDDELKTGNGLELSKVMGGNDSIDFSRADSVREFNFPEDHGPHNEFRTEWWYLTGNLVSGEGLKFGYQFTIFRTALTKQKKKRKSDWNSNQIYMGHFAVTDVEGEDFYFDETFSRDGNKLAGATVNPMRIWIENWEIEQLGDELFFDLPVLKISASMKDVEIEFIVKSEKPYVLQGNNGLSQKGKEPGNASYYYSYTRLNTEGEIKLKDKTHDVSGYSWMDREWSTSALDETQAGWDWFSLQLDSNFEIMYYQMRKNDGTADIYSKGVIVNDLGEYDLIGKDDVNLEVTEFWESPTGSEYPSGWKFDIPEYKISLVITPVINDQLMDVSINYWEGSVNIEGSYGMEPISGRGYVELTGY